MVARIISGIIGIPVAVILILAGGGLPFTIAVGVVAALGIREFYRGVAGADVKPHCVLGAVSCIALIVLARFAVEGRSTTLFPALFSIIFLAMLAMELRREPSQPVKNIGATLLGLAYVGGLFANMVLLRGIPGRRPSGTLDMMVDNGAWLLLFVFLSTWACDTFAYFIGRKWGTKKLIPRLSPGKSIEGSIAGFLGSVLVATVFGSIIRLPLAHCLALGALIGVFCQVGDLVESSMKREIGIKDFGAILPGHGGALDRFDSLLFTTSVTYYYAIYLLKDWLARI